MSSFEHASQSRSGEAAQRNTLLAEIHKLKEGALAAQRATGYPLLEMLQVGGSKQGQCGGFKLAKFWLNDRGSAVVGTDYLLNDGTFASSYEGRVLRVIDRWDEVSASRLSGILKGIEQLFESRS